MAAAVVRRASNISKLFRGQISSVRAFSGAVQPELSDPEAPEVLQESSSAVKNTYEPDIVHAFPRARSGTISASKIRKLKQVPSVLSGLPGNKHRLLALPENEINKYIRQYRPSGVASRLFFIEVTEEDGSVSELYPALAKAIHKTATTDVLENVSWMYAPMGKIVDVEVPVRIFGEDICPGIKKGGFVRYIRWTVTCRCQVPQIPTNIALDVSKLELGNKVFLTDIQEQLAAMGVRIYEKHTGDPIIMISEAGSD